MRACSGSLNDGESINDDIYVVTYAPKHLKIGSGSFSHIILVVTSSSHICDFTVNRQALPLRRTLFAVYAKSDKNDTATTGK